MCTPALVASLNVSGNLGCSSLSKTIQATFAEPSAIFLLAFSNN
jgi:hypothetical protein